MVFGWFPWVSKVVSWFLMVFWLVSMVFQGGFMVFHGFCLVYRVFQSEFGILAMTVLVAAQICEYDQGWTLGPLRASDSHL